MKKIIRNIMSGLYMALILTFITGFLYTVVVSIVARSFFSYKAAGSLIEKNGVVVGSQLIGQHFDQDKYFWGRAETKAPQELKILIHKLYKTGDGQKIPLDLLTSSGSGIDPHISPAAAFFQAPRVAKARHLSVDKVNKLIERYIQKRELGFLGEKRVNVLLLNLALDDAKFEK